MIRKRMKAVSSSSRYRECQNIIAAKIIARSAEVEHILHVDGILSKKQTFVE